MDLVIRIGLILLLFNQLSPWWAAGFSLLVLGWPLPKRPLKPKPPSDSRLGALARVLGSVERHHVLGEIPSAEYDRLRKALLRLMADESSAGSAVQRRIELERGWALLRGQLPDLGEPPWRQDSPPAKSAPIPAAQPIPPAVTPLVSPPPIPPAATPPPAPSVIAPVPPTPEPVPPPPPTWRERGQQYLREIALPFLWQNVGWLIGGFMVVAGSMFLVATTSGLSRALVVWASLGAYAGLLLWGGAVLRRRRPELRGSADILLMLGVLLTPLVVASAARCVQGAGHGWELALSLVVGVVTLAAMLPALTLAIGLIHRPLVPDHPRLLWGLLAFQFATPVLAWWDWQAKWLALGALHLGLLGLLALALRRFAQEWLRGIFLDKTRTAYFSAGGLAYAATVAFVHLAWGGGVVLPAGYAGPFLMALCGLLWYADWQVKRWVHRQPWLDYFRFVVYGLSIPALMLAWEDPTALRLTLGLATVLYGAMTWSFPALPPLALALASAAGWYALTVLQPFSMHTHFLLGVPFFGLVLLVYRFALQRRAAQLASLIEPMVLAGVWGLLGWSLWFATPGWISLATVLAAAGLVARLQNNPAHWLGHATAYGFFVLLAMAVWFTPRFLAAEGLQIALGWGLLSLLLTVGLTQQRRGSSIP